MTFAEDTLPLRVPPHDESAEVAVLGSVLLEGGISKVPEPLDLAMRDFYFEKHRLIWEALTTLDAEGTPADLVTVQTELARTGKLDEAGGLTYLIGLGERVPSSAYAEHYARIVREKSLLRQMIRASGEFMGECFGGQKPLEELIAQAAQISTVGGELPGARIRSIGEASADVVVDILNGRRTAHLGTGLKDLDDQIGGLEGGRLIIIAGRPSMGKSALAMQIGLNVAKVGARVLAVSLEMPDTEITLRLLAQEARVGVGILYDGMNNKRRLGDRERDRLMQADTQMRTLPLTFDDKSGLTLDELVREVRREHQREPLGLLIVDYLQILTVPELESNLTAKTTRISQTLKRLARELNIPIICLSQLSRKVEERPNKRPLMSDLRDSGAVEQDADVIMLIYRDEYYNKDTDQQGIAEIIVAKQRSGPTGTVKTSFNGHFLKFADLAYE